MKVATWPRKWTSYAYDWSLSWTLKFHTMDISRASSSPFCIVVPTNRRFLTATVSQKKAWSSRCIPSVWKHFNSTKISVCKLQPNFYRHFWPTSSNETMVKSSVHCRTKFISERSELPLDSVAINSIIHNRNSILYN